jgi:hypothetical protein
MEFKLNLHEKQSIKSVYRLLQVKCRSISFEPDRTFLFVTITCTALNTLQEATKLDSFKLI